MNAFFWPVFRAGDHSQVRAWLPKSRTSNEELVKTVNAVLGNPIYTGVPEIARLGVSGGIS